MYEGIRIYIFMVILLSCSLVTLTAQFSTLSSSSYPCHVSAERREAGWG